MNNGTKTCTRCLHEKSVSEFGSHFDRAKPRLQSRCRACRVGDSEASRLKRIYGMTPADRQQLESNQSGACLICRSCPTGKGANARLNVDHNHVTGKVRGLLCGRCNKVLGLMDDDAGRLRAAAEYLERNV